MRVNTNCDHPIETRLWRRRWGAAIVIVAVLVIIGGYWWNRERIWTLTGPDGRSVCHVREGWNEQEVFLHCGVRSGRGWQPKVVASGHGLDLRMCSAPGDVYRSKVVLYGCDGNVVAVEHLPAQDFIYHSD
jgi:hypothetical protein